MKHDGEVSWRDKEIKQMQNGTVKLKKKGLLFAVFP